MSDEANIFEEIRKDHEIQRDLLEMIVDTSGNTKQRRIVFRELKKSLLEHAKYEEKYFYLPLMEMDSTQKLARHSVAEHEQIDKKLDELQDTEMSSSAWLTKARELKDLVEHHLAEEETEVFRPAGKYLSSNDKVDLAKDYMAHMQNVRDIPSTINLGA